MALAWNRWCTAATYVALPLAVSCNAIWGVDSLRYDRSGPGSTTAAGTDGGGGTSSAGSGGNPSGGAGGCAPADCGDCSSPSCAEGRCADEMELCKQSANCADLASCMSDCAPLAVECQSDCIETQPTAVATFYQQFECTSCETQQCTQVCSGMCDGGCSLEATTCLECINSLCARTVCAGPDGACAQSAACGDFASCIGACPSDDGACTGTCVTSNPAGADLYNAVIRCTLCTKPACWDLCAADTPSCAGYAAT